MHVCVFLSQSASVEHSHRFLGPSKMADRPGPRRDRTGHLASHFRCFPAVFPLCSRCFSAVFPLCSRWIYNHQASGGTARGRAKKCLCMSRQAHASSSCEWSVCSCLKVRQSSILGPSAVQNGGSAFLQKQVLCPRTFFLHHQTARICADSSTGVYPFLTTPPY